MDFAWLCSLGTPMLAWVLMLPYPRAVPMQLPMLTSVPLKLYVLQLRGVVRAVRKTSQSVWHMAGGLP